MTIRWLIGAALITSLLAGCSWRPSLPKFKIPRVHKIVVQQGNVITQEMVDQLKPGMTRSQVVFVMGEPVMKNPFNKDRWDYVYTVDVPGVGATEQHMSLFFEEELLASFSGNFAPSGAIEAESEVDPEHIIEDLPPEEQAELETAEG